MKDRETNEYTLGWGALAEQIELDQETRGDCNIYHFLPKDKPGWICQMNPSQGLFVSSAWFTPKNQINYRIYLNRPAMWLFCVDCGEISITQQGKAKYHIGTNMHIFINPQKPFRMQFPKGVHTCFTSILVFDSFIENALLGRSQGPKIQIKDAAYWKKIHYDLPYIMLIMEQLRWAVRGLYFNPLGVESLVIHLLTAIAQNYPKPPKFIAQRHCYVNWENEQKIDEVKKQIDKDILNLPSVHVMCQMAEMSESKFRNSFKNLYGMPLYEYIKRETMKKAMQLLSADHLSISDIAELCGYNNQSKFAAAFKSIHGISPSQFRKSFNL